ncbi:hypothetical protein OUM_1579 [Helicobacter pylori R038b]|uniref:Uncharacterized protein n=1 Tax=Helicobacter pylori R038b TaxID=1145115 RepID=K2JY59_HELPX|nr:hypothetical protein OUM_1579 [Helicobacter pylori R038b]
MEKGNNHESHGDKNLFTLISISPIASGLLEHQFKTNAARDQNL